MTTKIKTCAQAIQTKLVALTNGVAPPNTVTYFDHVWVGVPKKIPMGDRCIAMVQPTANPNYYYTSCNANTQYDVDFMIDIISKGKIDTATLYILEVVEAVQNALFSDQKISNSCLGSTVEDVEYIDVVADEKNLATGARIRLRCRL
jgi:hypothetical protein